MSTYISKEEGLYLLNYTENAIRDIEVELKYMNRYIQTALSDQCSLSDQTALGLQFKESMDIIDSISGHAIYGTSRVFPSNMDYTYLNQHKFADSNYFASPTSADYNSLFKRNNSISINLPLIENKPFKENDNSGYTYVNCNFTNSTSSTPIDISSYSSATQYYGSNAENFITLIFPALTVDALFSSYRLSSDVPYSGIQEMMCGTSASPTNPFTYTSAASSDLDLIWSGDTKAKVKIWSYLMKNLYVSIKYLNRSITGNNKKPFVGSSGIIPIRSFNRLNSIKEFIALQKNIINGLKISSSINDAPNLNKENNSIPDDIRFSDKSDSLIDIVSYLPQFMRDAYPDAAEFMVFFQDYLNTMYTGESSYVQSYGSGTNSKTYDKDGNELIEEAVSISIPQSQRISILEKIKRLSELHDPDLIDFEFLSHFANMLGYKSSGFSINHNDSYNSLALGYSFQDEDIRDISIDSKKYLRNLVSNLPSFYKIKSTNNCIKVLMYSFGLIGDIQNVYSSDYSKDWVHSTNVFKLSDPKDLASPMTMQEDFSNISGGGVYGPYMSTPHFKINIDLVKSSSSISFDMSKSASMFRFIDSVRPINTVFDGLNGMFYTNQNCSIYLDPPKTVLFGSSNTDIDIVKPSTISISDNFMNKYDGSSNFKYSMKLKDVWRNGYSDTSTFTNLPVSSAACTLLDSASKKMGIYAFNVPGVNDMNPEQFQYAKKYLYVNASPSTGYGNKKDTIIYPGLNPLSDATISATFTQVTSAVFDSVFSNAIGFSTQYKATSADTYHDSFIKFGVQYKTSTSGIEYYRSVLGTAYTSAVSTLQQVNIDGKISLKAVKHFNPLNSDMIISFYSSYKIKMPLPNEPIETFMTEIVPMRITLHKDTTGNYPMYNSSVGSKYTVLNTLNYSSNMLALTGLSLIASI